MRVIAILGPTGSGKSALALKIAERIPSEIVSCDSVQLYRGFNIGADKVSQEVRKKIPHHMVDIIQDCRRFSAAEYAKEAAGIIREIWERGRYPIVVGGTLLYFRALEKGLFPFGAAGEKFRRTWRAHPQELRRRSMELDPLYYSKIGANDSKRMVRLMEVYHISGKNMTEAATLTTPPLPEAIFLKFAINIPRQELYRRIEERVERMFRQGLVEEVRALLAMGYPEDCPPFEAIGYREVLSFIKGEIELQKAKDLIKKHTKEYARRQLMWLRREENLIWVSPHEVDKILESLERK